MTHYALLLFRFLQHNRFYPQSPFPKPTSHHQLTILGHAPSPLEPSHPDERVLRLIRKLGPHPEHPVGGTAAKSQGEQGHGMRVMENVTESFGEDAPHDQERT
jgi:hypothetical protein